MKTRVALASVLCVALSLAGCRGKADRSTDASTEKRLDFEALLKSVDNVVGKRFQSMQMAGMESATYQYDGPIDTVLDIVRPIAEEYGFSEEARDLEGGMGPAEQEMQRRMGINVTVVEHKMFTHANGDTLTVSRMDTSYEGSDMKMLTIHLVDQQEMFDSLDER